VFKNGIKKRFAMIEEKLWEVASGPMHYDLSLENKVRL